MFGEREKKNDGKYNLYKLTIIPFCYIIGKKYIYLYSLNNIKFITLYIYIYFQFIKKKNYVIIFIIIM